MSLGVRPSGIVANVPSLFELHSIIFALDDHVVVLRFIFTREYYLGYFCTINISDSILFFRKCVQLFNRQAANYLQDGKHVEIIFLNYSCYFSYHKRIWFKKRTIQTFPFPFAFSNCGLFSCSPLNTAVDSRNMRVCGKHLLELCLATQHVL